MSTRSRSGTQRTYQQLKDGLWSNLQLTESTGAQQKIQNTIDAFDKGKQVEYKTFWQFDANYDSQTQKVELTAAEEAGYRNLFTAQGKTPAEVDAAIATIENARTQQYLVLKDQFTAYFNGQLPAAYDPSFVYVLSQAKVNEITASIKVWKEEELLGLFSSGLLKPVTSTRADIEAPNIVATDTTIVAPGATSAARAARFPFSWTATPSRTTNGWRSPPRNVAT